MRAATTGLVIASILGGVITFHGTVTAEPFRVATVGDRMGSLTVGLTRVPIGSGRCGSVPATVVGWSVPGRPLDLENASVAGVLVDGKVVVVASYDEQNLSQAVTVYADLDGRGIITNVWSIGAAPPACTIVGMLHHSI